MKEKSDLLIEIEKNNEKRRQKILNKIKAMENYKEK